VVSVAPLRVARGIQNKVLEAIAAGLPCVVSEPVMEGLPDEVAGACLRADGEEPFAEAVVRLLAIGAHERHNMVARARLEPLGWERRLAPLEGILAAAAATSARRTA
jgi:hypothetical protein